MDILSVMSITVSGAKLIEEAELQVNHAEYDGAWSTYHEFRESVNDADHDARTLRVLDEAERAAETSFRAGAVGFESQMRTLLFAARRLVESAEAQP